MGRGQHDRVAGLNLLAAIVIYRNTVRWVKQSPGEGRARSLVSAELLPHTLPHGWGHLLINGEYGWPNGR